VRLDYEAWIEALAPLMVRSPPPRCGVALTGRQATAFRDRVNFQLMTAAEFYKSPWHTIRANAATLCSRLLAAVPLGDRRNINVDQACVGAWPVGWAGGEAAADAAPRAQG
jgi:hypothetical protein